MKPPISDSTKSSILDAAWRLIATEGLSDASQARIAAAAGVSRQTIFYAFGNRAGLLTAMLRHMDSLSPEVARIRALSASPRTDDALAADYLDAWLDYLPRVYPVAILLDAAALTDSDARVAINDRMVDALLAGFTRFFARLAITGRLRDGVDPTKGATEIWAAVHLSAWRLLVVERGWSVEEFRRSRQAILQGILK